ncbi:MAG: winged helix-turn-helix domain-containing protein [Hyphomicrobiaceae bacterium]|nr:winged helix-turn-helix domain-containing protein [Hyphomicrobiaceae bacterium]
MARLNHILVVSDEPELRTMVGGFLERSGYRVTTVDCGKLMRRVVTREPVDLVVVDIELPGECGIALTRFLREHTQIGIVALTASETSVDRIVTLEAGADDCLARPVDLRELLARTKAVTRRVGLAQAALSAGAVADRETVTFGECELDLAAHRLIDAGGEEIPLTAMEYALLRAFAEHPGRVLNRDELAELAHNRDWSPFDRSLDIRISRLRRKIEPNPARPRVIETVRGVGYRFQTNAQVCGA